MIKFAEEDNDLDLPDHSGTSIRLVHKHVDPRIVSVHAPPPSSSSLVVCNCKYLSYKSSAILDSNENVPRRFNFVLISNRRCCKHSGTNFSSSSLSSSLTQLALTHETIVRVLIKNLPQLALEIMHQLEKQISSPAAEIHA